MPKARPSSPDRYQASREGFFGTAITTHDEEQLGLGSPGGPIFTVSSPLVGQLVRNSQILATTTTTTTSAFHQDDAEYDEDIDQAPTPAELEENAPEGAVTSPTATSWITSWFKPSPAKKAAEEETPFNRSDSQDTTTIGTSNSNAVLAKKEKRAAKKQRQAAAKEARIEAAEVVVSTTNTTPVEARKEPAPKAAAKKERTGAAFWEEGRKEDAAAAAQNKARNGPRSDVRPGMYHHHAVLQPLTWRDFVCDGNPDVIEAPSRTTFTITGNTAEEGDQVVLNPNSVEAILQRVEARVAAKELAIKQEKIEAQRRMRAKEDRIVARRAQSEKSAGWGFSWVTSMFKSGDRERAVSVAETANDEEVEETPAQTVVSDNDAESSDDDGEVDPDFVPRYLADKGRSVSGIPAKHRGSSTAPPSVARSLADSFGRDSSDEEGSDAGIDHDAERTLAEGDDFGELSRLRWKRRLERLSNKKDVSADRKEPRKKQSSARNARNNVPLMLSPDGASPQPLLPSSVRLSDANLSPISAVSSKGASTTTTAGPDTHYQDLAVEFKAHTSVYSTGFNAIIPRLGSTKDNTPRVSADDSVLYDFAHRLQTGNLEGIGSSKVGEATVWEQVGLHGRPAGVVRVPASSEQIANFQIGHYLSNKLRSVLVRARTQQEPRHLAEEEAKRIRSERALAARKSQKGRGSTSQRSSTVLDDAVGDSQQSLHSYGLTTAKSNAYVARHFVVEDLITLLDFQNIYFGRSSESLFRASHRPSEVRNMLIQSGEEEDDDASLLPFLTIPVASMQKSELLEHAAFVLERLN